MLEAPAYRETQKEHEIDPRQKVDYSTARKSKDMIIVPQSDGSGAARELLGNIVQECQDR